MLQERTPHVIPPPAGSSERLLGDFLSRCPVSTEYRGQSKHLAVLAPIELTEHRCCSHNWVLTYELEFRRHTTYLAPTIPRWVHPSGTVEGRATHTRTHETAAQVMPSNRLATQEARRQAAQITYRPERYRAPLTQRDPAIQNGPTADPTGAQPLGLEDPL